MLAECQSVIGRQIVNEGKIRAWLNDRGDRDGVVAAYVGISEGRTPLRRAPATRFCGSAEEARQWVEAEARELDVSIKWKRPGG